MTAALDLAEVTLESYDPNIDVGAPSTVAFAHAIGIIDDTPLVPFIERLMTERRGRGGRPGSLTVRHVLIVLQLLALEGRPLHQKAAAQLIAHRFTASQRAALGIPAIIASPGSRNRPTDFEHTRKLWQQRFHDKLQTIIAALDPYPMVNKKTLLTKEEFAERLEAIDSTPEEVERRLSILETVVNQIVEGSLQRVPVEYRFKHDGHFGLDASAFAAHSRGKTKRSTHMPIEPDAGWYRRDGDHAADEATPTPLRVLYGYEGTFVVATRRSQDEPETFPLLAYAFTMGAPGVRIARLAVSAVSDMKSRGHHIEYLIADRAYFVGQNVKGFHIPLRSMKVKFVTDYRIDQLGETVGFEGARQVEGSWYCPAIKQHLVDATKNYRNGDISYNEWQEAIADRGYYLATPKESRDADGYQRHMCPAAKGRSSTLLCPLKNEDEELPRNYVEVEDPPERPAKLCTQNSISIPPDEGLKYGQDVRFGTPRWMEIYGCGRNSTESFNAMIKDESHEGLGQSGRRRTRGFTAQYLMVAMLVASANVRKINTFVAEQQRMADGHAPRTRAKRRNRALPPWLSRYGLQNFPENKPHPTGVDRAAG